VIEAPTQEVAGGSHLERVDIGCGEVPASQQHGDLEGVDFVVLDLSAVDGLPVERVTENELDAFAPTQVGDPVPGEHALDADDEIIAVGCDGFEEVLGSRTKVLVEPDLRFPVKDAEIHGLCVQVDPAVVLVGVDVELHGSLLEWFWLAPTSLRRLA